MNIDWPALCANLVVIGSAVAGFGIWYKGYIIDQVRLVLNESVVEKKEYEKFTAGVKQEFDSIKQFHTEFKVIAAEVGQVKDGQVRLEQIIKNNSDEQSRQLTQSMNSIRDRFDDMKDLIQASK